MSSAAQAVAAKEELDSVQLVYQLIFGLLVAVGSCCCWLGSSLGRRLGVRKSEMRTIGTMTDEVAGQRVQQAQPPPFTVIGLERVRRQPQTQMMWTSVRAASISGTGCFHTSEACGSLANAGARKAWRRCLRPECGGELV